MQVSHRLGSALALATAVALFASSRAAAQPYHLEDSLRGSTTGNAIGGSFDASGWTVTGVEDRIWYALPRLESGYVEFTVAQITLASLPLADHEFFAMYEAGHGITEPIRYNPEFRQNHYKMLLRIYGTAEPSRQGFMKLMWGMCPSGAPGYDDGSGCGCASFFEEPFDDPGAWTGAPVRIRVEWGAGTTRLLRDGVEVVNVDWSSSGLSFGPSDLHMMIGSPRNDGSLSAMPIGAVFSDLVVDGNMGPLATCPGTSLPDAGPPPDAPGCDASRTASADATAASWEPGVYPDASDLNVEGDGASPTAVVYLRFPPVPGPVTSATLTLDTSNVASAGGGSGQACRVDGGSWDEASLTWSTRPMVSGACSGGARTLAAGEEMTWDVTSLVVPGAATTFAIVSTDPNGAHFHSRESGGCTLGPRLTYTLAAPVDAGPIATTDAGPVATLDAGPGMDAGASAADAGPRRPLTSGCSCRVGGARHGAPAFFVATALAVLTLGRRRHARR